MNAISFSTKPHAEFYNSSYAGDAAAIPVNATVSAVRLYGLNVPIVPTIFESTLLPDASWSAAYSFTESAVYDNHELAAVAGTDPDAFVINPNVSQQILSDIFNPLTTNLWMSKQPNKKIFGNFDSGVLNSSWGLTTEHHMINIYGWFRNKVIGPLTTNGVVPILYERTLHCVAGRSNSVRFRYWIAGVQAETILVIPVASYTLLTLVIALQKQIDIIAPTMPVGARTIGIASTKQLSYSFTATDGFQFLPVDSTPEGKFLHNALGGDEPAGTAPPVASRASAAVDLSSPLCILSKVLSKGSSAGTAISFDDYRSSKYYVTDFDPYVRPTNKSGGWNSSTNTGLINTDWIYFDTPVYIDNVDLKFAWPHGPIALINRYITGTLEYK